jgi:hypothetical protein
MPSTVVTPTRLLFITIESCFTFFTAGCEALAMRIVFRGAHAQD